MGNRQLTVMTAAALSLLPRAANVAATAARVDAAGHRYHVRMNTDFGIGFVALKKKIIPFLIRADNLKI